MAGILDPKERIMDTIITEEGRRQMSAGNLRIHFASFTDGHTFYDSDDGESASDATNRPFFEATSLPSDRIILEADEFGNMETFKSENFNLFKGRVYLSGSSTAYSGSVKLLANELTTFTTKNFQQQNIVGTKLIYQRKPTLRIHLPENKSVGGFHRDRDYNHPIEEINIWLF